MSQTKVDNCRHGFKIRKSAHRNLINATLAHLRAGMDIPCIGPDQGAWTLDQDTFMDHAVDRCHACPALELCANYALTFAEPTGVWGGLTPARRTEIRASAHPAAAAQT